MHLPFIDSWIENRIKRIIDVPVKNTKEAPTAPHECHCNRRWEKSEVLETVMPHIMTLKEAFREFSREIGKDRFEIHKQFKNIGIDMETFQKRLDMLNIRVTLLDGKSLSGDDLSRQGRGGAAEPVKGFGSTPTGDR